LLVHLSRWYLGSGRSSLTAWITRFGTCTNIFRGGALRGHDHEFVGKSNEVQFRSSSATARTSKRRVGWFGFMSPLSTAGWAAPTHRMDSGAEVLALHLSDAFTDSQPAQDGPYATVRRTSALYISCSAPRTSSIEGRCAGSAAMARPIRREADARETWHAAC
jgi:hypothetical protein